MNTHPFIKRKFVLVFLALLGLAIVLFRILGNTPLNPETGVRRMLPTFDTSANRVLERSEDILRKARDFDEETALRNIGRSRFCGTTYRFDDLTVEEFSAPHSENEDIGNDLFALDFDETDSHPFSLTGGDSVVKDGILTVEFTGKEILESTGDLDIPEYVIGEIAVRARLQKGRRMQIGWSKDPNAQWGDPGKRFDLERFENIGVITVDTVPDNEFHTYRIAAHNHIRKRLLYGESIRKVFVLPSDVKGDKIELDFIKLISRREKFAAYPFGRSYENIGKQMRKVLYTVTPLSLTYKVSLPDEKTSMRFGLGVLEENNPVTFRVIVHDENGREEIFSQVHGNATEWKDIKLDLADWAGKTVQITLDTSSAGGNIAFWSNPVIYAPVEQPLNVIVVLEDALRADRMSCYGHSRETTPFKDEFFGKEGVVFDYAFSQATKTRMSVPSMMTSLLPSATGVWDFFESLDDSYLTLAEILRSQGFATASFVPNGNAGPFGGLHQGYEVLIDNWEPKGEREDSVYGIIPRAEDIYSDKLYEWIEKNSDRNLFLYIHIVDPHGPYNPPPPYDSWYQESSEHGSPLPKDPVLDPPWIETPTQEGRRLLYDGEIRYNDDQFKGFVEKLSELISLDDTLIILLADHGEFLGEHGLWEHHPPGYIQVLHVPLLMRYPSQFPQGVSIQEPVQLIDVMPTVLDLAGIPLENLMIHGDSVLPLIRGEEKEFWRDRLVIADEVAGRDKSQASAWGSVFYRNWHIVNSQDFSSQSEIARDDFSEVDYVKVFDYHSDKEESHALEEFQNDSAFKEDWSEFLRELQQINLETWRMMAGAEEKTISYDPETLRKLKILGYMQ